MVRWRRGEFYSPILSDTGRVADLSPKRAMITINIRCTCGQHLAFEVEPLLGQAPWPVKCPTCGADNTTATNECIARELAAAPGGLKLRTPPPVITSSATAQRDPSLGFRGTYASNPALLRVNWAKANSTRPAALWLSVVMIIFGALVIVAFHPVPGICLIIAAVWSYWTHRKEVTRKFWAGDVCPGIILSDKLVAVMTDLKAQGALKRPALKVMWYPVKKMTGGLPPAGSRVATVALYYGPVKDGAWRNFSPEVIACWVTDENEIQRVTNSISEQEWKELEHLLAQIPKPLAGSYKMWGPQAGKVKRAMDPSVEMILAALIALLIFGPLTFGMISKWKSHHKEQPTPIASESQPAAQAPVTKPSEPAAPPAPASRVQPKTDLAISQVRTPAPVISIDLRQQIATFTNLQGKGFTNVTLIRADAKSGLVYSFVGGAGSLPFSGLPAEFLVGLGVPTNWPGVLSGKQTSSTNTIVEAKPPRTGLFEVGDRVQVSWAGKWEPAMILAFRNQNIVVRFTSPTTPFRNEIYVPTNWVRLSR